MNSPAISLEFRIVPDRSPIQPAASSAAVVNNGQDAPLLHVLGVRKAYGGLEAVSGVDLSLIQGRITITPDGGKPVSVGPGDAFVVEAGFKGVWKIEEKVLKHFDIKLK